MKIQSSSITLAGRHLAVQKHHKSESLRAWVGDRRPDFEGRGRQVQAPGGDRLSLSARAQMTAMTAEQGVSSKDAGAVNPERQLEDDPRSLLLRLMIQTLTGRKIEITSLDKMSGDGAQATDPRPPQDAQAAPSEPAPVGYGVEYARHESYSEAEQTDFSAQGLVRTADGKEITFSLQMSMSRSYSTQTDVSLRLGDAARNQKDPLVINFGGSAAQLSSTKFTFDLNADGQSETIAFPGSSSGFIALDKNNDGVINNGSELFGALSGDGFADLAAYDQDQNGWIDENDPIFEQLKIWSKGETGADHLVGLKASGVGALYLSKVSTPFELKTSANDSLGTVRSTGVYLNENGSVGTLQQVDLTV